MALKNDLKYIKIKHHQNSKFQAFWVLGYLPKVKPEKKRLIRWQLSNYILIISINEFIMKSQWKLVLVLHNLEATSFSICKGLSATLENAVYIMVETNLFCLETLSSNCLNFTFLFPPLYF